MANYIAVFLGGGIGSVLRYLISMFFVKHISHSFPYATFTVNILGCLFIGFIISLSMTKSNLCGSSLLLFLTVGIAGGFTTFSTFSYESFALIKNGETLTAVTYIVLSSILGLLAVYFGTVLGKTFN
jgi:fluoride exporter